MTTEHTKETKETKESGAASTEFADRGTDEVDEFADDPPAEETA